MLSPPKWSFMGLSLRFPPCSELLLLPRCFASDAQAAYSDASLLTLPSAASPLQTAQSDGILQRLRKLAARSRSKPKTLTSSEIEAISHSLRTLGLEAQTEEFLGNLAILPVARKVKLLEMKGVTASDVKSLLVARAFIVISLQTLANVLDLLKNFFLTGEIAGKVLAQNKGVLLQPIEHLQRKLKELDDFEIGKEAGLRIGTAPHVLAMKVDSLHGKLVFLQKIGLDVKSRQKLLCKFPRVLSLSIGKSLQPTVDFFKSRGMDSATMMKLLCSRPELFGMSIEKNVVMKFDLLEQLGFTTQESFRAISFLSQVSCQRILAQYDILKNYGFSHDEVCMLGRRQPDIFAKAEENIKKKLDYLVKVGHRDIKEIVRFPAYLGYSLEQRIVPRFSLLKEKDLLSKYSLSAILSMKDEVFRERFETEDSTKTTS